jgi:hypothetical protein
MSAKNHGVDSARNQRMAKNQRIQVLGSTGRTRKVVIAELGKRRIPIKQSQPHTIAISSARSCRTPRERHEDP